MSNRKQHRKVGTTVGGTVAAGSYLFDYLKTCNQCKAQGMVSPKFDWMEFIGTTLLGGGVGAAGGVLPDILEPATHSYHRKTMHSVTAGTALTTLIVRNQSKMTRSQKSIANAFGASYLSHLVLDSQTPRGIPLI